MIRFLALLAFALVTPLSVRAEPLTVMSFNVRLPADSDGPDRWSARRDRFLKVWRGIGADVVGTQELFREQGEAIVKADPRYAWFGRDRKGGHGDEHMGIFYRRDRLRLIDSGDFWLSDTPDQPGSISWGHPLPRMVNWGRFERIADGRRFTVINTHFPYRGEDEDAREKGARAIAAFVGTLPTDEPVALTGDFNTVPESAAYAALTARLADAWTTAPRRSGTAATFHGFTGKADRRIDWIMTRGFTVEAIRTDDRPLQGRYPSDHFPVIATLDFPVRRP